MTDEKSGARNNAPRSVEPSRKPSNKIKIEEQDELLRVGLPAAESSGRRWLEVAKKDGFETRYGRVRGCTLYSGWAYAKATPNSIKFIYEAGRLPSDARSDDFVESPKTTSYAIVTYDTEDLKNPKNICLAHDRASIANQPPPEAVPIYSRE